MTLINTSYFYTGEYSISNIQGTSPVNVAVQNNVNYFINKYEPELLKKLFGKTMYDEFITGLSIIPIPDKWVALRDKLIDSTNKFSLITPYVYGQFRLKTITQSNSLGESAAKQENAKVVSADRKLIDAWNDLNKQCYDFTLWLNESAQLATYPTQETNDLQFYTNNDFGI